MGKKILSIIIVLILCAGACYGAYSISNYLDKKAKESLKVVLTTTFDDTKTYVIPNSLESNKDAALKEWPYMFTIKNEGNYKGLYQLIINDIEGSTIKRENLSYVLILDDKEIQEGKLCDLKDNILYTYEINKETSQRYKLYIWVNSSNTKKEDIYEYSITLNAIKDGGPGF